MKNSQFKTFCQNKWYEHRDEILAWTGQPVSYDRDHYFAQYRWLLKRQYIEQYARENAQFIQKSIKRTMKRGNL